MPRKIFYILFPLSLTVLLSCSKMGLLSSSVDSSTSEAKEQGARYRTVDDFVDDKGYEMVQDEETGFMKPVSTRKSHPFQNQVSDLQRGQDTFSKSFNAKYYDTDRWDGSEKKKGIFPWQRSKDKYDHSPHFIKKNADLAGKVSEDAGKSYATTALDKKSAREASVPTAQEKLPNYVVEQRRKDYVPPPIISNQNYNESGRSVEDVKQILSQ